MFIVMKSNKWQIFMNRKITNLKNRNENDNQFETRFTEWNVIIVGFLPNKTFLIPRKRVVE